MQLMFELMLHRNFCLPAKKKCIYRIAKRLENQWHFFSDDDNDKQSAFKFIKAYILSKKEQQSRQKPACAASIPKLETPPSYSLDLNITTPKRFSRAAPEPSLEKHIYRVAPQTPPDQIRPLNNVLHFG